MNTQVKVQENVPLHVYTTLKTGGVARYMAEVHSEAELIDILDFVHLHKLPLLILGYGSNVLVMDEGFDGMVIQNKIKGYSFNERSDGTVILSSAAGEILDDIIEETVRRGFFGLENLSAIPGTIGATPVQNVGAYGVEVGDIISHVDTINTETKQKKRFLNNECNFGYRESFFKTSEGKKYFITAVHMKLKKEFSLQLEYADLKKYFSDSTPSLIRVREAITAIRSKKFPDWHIVGTAGSFFKNPIVTADEASRLKSEYPLLPLYDAGNGMSKIALGYVLDKICGLKGYRSDNVGLFEEQALVLVNYGATSGEEIKKFAAYVAAQVYEKIKINITPEVTFIEKK